MKKATLVMEKDETTEINNDRLGDEFDDYL